LLGKLGIKVPGNNKKTAYLEPTLVTIPKTIETPTC